MTLIGTGSNLLLGDVVRRQNHCFSRSPCLLRNPRPNGHGFHDDLDRDSMNTWTASPTTVGEYLRRAKSAGISYPLPADIN